MLKRLVCSICCTAEPNVTIQIQLFHRSGDQTHSNNKISLESNRLSPKASLGQKADFLSPPTHLHSGSTCSVLSAFDLSYYCLYIFLINGDGGVLIDQDLIYISESESPLPKSVFELRKPNIGYLKVDSNHTNIGSCLYSTSCLMPFQSYSVSYLRINFENGRIHAIKTSLKFKIAFKDETQYPLKASLLNVFNQEYAIVLENEPLYEKLSKIKLEDLCTPTSKTHHRKGIKSLIDTAPLSIKTCRSSNDFSKITEKNSKLSKNSFFNSTFTDSNGLSSHVTNKNSVHENGEGPIVRKWSKTNSLNDPKKTPQHRRLQSHVSKESDGISCHKDVEGSIMMNETFVVNDNRENSDYVKKMCSAIERGDKGIFLNYQTPLNEQRDLVHSNYISVIEPDQNQELDIRVKPENLKTTTKKTELYRKPDVPFFSLRKAAKNSFFESQGPNKTVQDERRIEIAREEDDQAAKKSHQRLLFSPRDVVDSKDFSEASKKRAFRKILDIDDQENIDSNIIFTLRPKQPEPLMKTPIPKTFSSYGLFPTYGPVFPSDHKKTEEGQIAEEGIYSTPNRPKNSKTVSTLSDKKFRKSGDFSFNGKIEELFTAGNIQTTSDTESIKVTPRLNNMLGSINSGGTPDIKTLLLPGERLYTVEEVGTPSRELSTLGDGNSHFKSFHSRRSLRKNNNNTNSIRLKNSDIGIVSELNEDEERNVSLLKFSQVGRDSDNMASLGGDLPLEVMIMGKKIEELGLTYIYEPTDCLLRVYDQYDKDFSFVYKWDQETTDRDLAEFFNDIRAALEARTEDRANSDEYVYL